MATISYELPPKAFLALHRSPKKFAREMWIAAVWSGSTTG